ncbi:MAG: hypothetical protein WHX52_12455 [Anaerolineae bacterium]
MKLFRSAKKEKAPAVERDCQHCDHFLTGDLDRGANWMRCDKGHRLVAEEALTIEHHLYYDPDEEIVKLTEDGWAAQGGTGEPMLGRTDCPDWKRKGFRLGFGNPEYD